jgi:arylsulfatase A-like enzyme
MKQLGRIAWAGATALIAISAFHQAKAGTPPGPQTPNVLLIVVDDMGYGDLGCYGSKQIRSPGIDRLAREGVRLTDCYANAPICSPTRAALMTGNYPQRAGLEWAVSYGERGVGLAASQPSLARSMRSAGFRTALFGKWHLGYDNRFNPTSLGFDEFFGFLAPDVDYYSHNEVTGEPGLYEGTKPVNRRGYITDLIAERALAFIDKNAGRKFFLEVAFNAPHYPFQPPGNPEDIRTLRTYGPLTGTRADYIQIVTHLDLRINDILRSIDDHGLTANTLVIFVSDNGGERLSSNAPYSGGKFTLWEGGIRVPCLLRWPGVISPGTVSHQAVITMDLAPLIMAACKVSVPGASTLDGVDVLPMITGKSPERERTFFWRIQSSLDPEPQKAMRRGRWKFVCEGDTEMLFDLETDPGEFRELGESNPKILAELKKAMREWEGRMPPVKARATLRDLLQ